MASRRTVLRTAAAAAGAGLLADTAAARPRHARTPPAAGSPDSAGLFRTAMPVAPVLAPAFTTGSCDIYTITMRRARKEIVPGLLTELLTYDGHFPGPTIKARSGRRVIVAHRNALEVPTSVHLHGGEVSSGNDGDPMHTIAPGSRRDYFYPNRQPHASLWYHDHAHHAAAESVYRGLSGFYLLTDETEEALPLPSGRYDVPVALRDARLDGRGRLVYEMDDVFGRTTILANGKAWPYFRVAARKYRFRLLNSSNMRFFGLRLADGSQFVQIGSDGGLLERPHPTAGLLLSPGERADVVIDFSRYRVGSQVVLENTLGPGPEQVGRVLRFDVTHEARDSSLVPDRLRSLAPLPAVTGSRSFELRMDEEESAGARAYINDRTYDPHRTDSRVPHGGSEIWTVTNTNRKAPHNFHVHLVQFRVLERNGGRPGPDEQGLKDTVRLLPGDTVKLQVTFRSYRGRYLYHCHMLDHAAMGMMATMEIE